MIRSILTTILFLGYCTIVSAQDNTEIIKLDSAINSSLNELNPVITNDGNTLYFTRANHKENAGGIKDPGDIWFANKKSDGNWETAQRIDGPINNRYFNGIIGFSQDGNRMFLHHHYYENERKFSRGVSVSEKRGNSWTFPKKVEVTYFENRSEHQSASLTHNRQVMLMSIESYGTYGVEDIYVSILQSNGEWTIPENLGSDINTRYQEMTPYLLPDNKTLIFASNGHDGYGSMDFFYSERLDDSWKNWSQPQNLGRPVNSSGREFYYFVPSDQEFAYFVTTQSSEGYGDIRKVKIQPDELPDPVEEEFVVVVEEDEPEIAESGNQITEDMPAVVDSSIMVTGFILSETSNNPISARLSFEPLADANQSGTVSDSTDGKYQIKLASADNYIVNISAKGYMNTEESLYLEADGESMVRKDFILSPLEVGRTFRLDNVLFHRGTTNLIDSSYIELDKVIQMMEDNPGIEIELSGHTDNQGSARLNLKLSQERVEKVKQYMVENGIDAYRISGKGYGGLKPIASNRSEKTRALNRRVEFTIMKNNIDE